MGEMISNSEGMVTRLSRFWGLCGGVELKEVSPILKALGKDSVQDMLSEDRNFQEILQIKGGQNEVI